jgi:hypothetical protein
MLTRLAFVAAVTLAALPADAQTCAETDLILDLAAQVLDERALVPRLQARRLGAEAAYLTIRYGQMDGVPALAFLDQLATAEPPLLQAADMARTLIARNQPAIFAITHDAANPYDVFAAQDRALMMAIVAWDRGQTYFRLWDEVEADTSRTSTGGLANTYLPAGLRAAALTGDDSLRARLAQEALDVGRVGTAAILASGLEDLSMYRDIVAGIIDEPELTEALSGPRINLNMLTAIWQETALNAVPDADGWGDTFYLMRHMAVAGQVNWLATFVNQTGETALGQEVAAALLAAVQGGTIDMDRAPEEGWLMMQDMLAEQLGPETVVSTLDSFSLPVVRHYAGSAAQTLAWARAARALRPFLSSELKALPNDPGLLADLDWANWLRIASALRAGPAESDDLSASDDALIAIELLIGAQRWDEMRAIADDLLEPVDRIRVFTDVIERLDRSCAGYTAISWQSVITGGAAFYDFAPRD